MRGKKENEKEETGDERGRLIFDIYQNKFDQRKRV
jgi:hypothetical protein